MAAIDLATINRVHFIGIGGVGMGAIAEIMVSQGYQVTGSDPKPNALTERLQQLGASIYNQHLAENINKAELIVVSSAIKQDNIEIQAAKTNSILVIARAQMLGALMQQQKGIAITGTHGKTTTSSLIAQVLMAGDLDPTFVIGARLPGFAANARLGQSPYWVVEADESDASFLYLNPHTVVVTNIDADHMATYGNDMQQLEQAFLQFIEQVPVDGHVIVCLDCPRIQQLLPQIKRSVITYGFHDKAMFQAINYQPSGLQSTFLLKGTNIAPTPICLNLPGAHNVQNALAAIALANQLGIDIEQCQAGLASFAGVDRRFQIHGKMPVAEGSVTVIEDYGHHPVELMASAKAVKSAFPNQRLVMVFQPHRYTRTRDLLHDFADVLAEVDYVVLTDVYAAGEAPIKEADSEQLTIEIEKRTGMPVVNVGSVAQLPAKLTQILTSNDVLLLQGAGDIGEMAPRLVKGH